MGALDRRIGRPHEFTPDRTGTLHAVSTGNRGEPLQIVQRVLDRAIDQTMNDEAVLRRVDVRNASVVSLIMETGRRYDSVAVLHRGDRRRLRRIKPPHLLLELGTGTIAS